MQRPDAYAGWVRSAGNAVPGPWIVACRAATETAAWRLLIPWRNVLWRSVEKLVLAQGQHPEQRRRPR